MRSPKALAKSAAQPLKQSNQGLLVALFSKQKVELLKAAYPAGISQVLWKVVEYGFLLDLSKHIIKLGIDKFSFTSGGNPFGSKVIRVSFVDEYSARELTNPYYNPDQVLERMFGQVADNYCIVQRGFYNEGFSLDSLDRSFLVLETRLQKLLGDKLTREEREVGKPRQFIARRNDDSCEFIRLPPLNQ